MLGTRTKQVFAYGKRGHRIVDVSEKRRSHNDNDNTMKDGGKDTDDYPSTTTSTASAKQRENTVLGNQPASRRDKERGAGSFLTSTNSVKATVAKASHAGKGKEKEKPKKLVSVTNKAAVAARPPLGVYLPNVPGSPAVSALPKKRKPRAVGSPTPVKKNRKSGPLSPFVDVDIEVMDDEGICVSREHRVNLRADLQAFASVLDSPVKSDGTERTTGMKPRNNADGEIAMSDAKGPQARRPKRAVRQASRPIVISSDESASDSDYTPPKARPRPEETSRDTSALKPRAVRAPQIKSTHVPQSHSETKTKAGDGSQPEAKPTLIPYVLLPPPRFTDVTSTIKAEDVQNTKPKSDIAPEAEILERKPSVKTFSESSDPTVSSPPPRPIHSRPKSSPYNQRLPSQFPAQPQRLNPSVPSYATQNRQLTPIKTRLNGRNEALFPHSRHPPPSSSVISLSDTDLSLEAELANLDLVAASDEEEAEVPDYLTPLLDECMQRAPHEFSAFIETFPFDPIVQDFDLNDDEASVSSSSSYVKESDEAGNRLLRFRKIGEASYSEVFGIGDVVLKVIPIRDESPSPPNAKAKHQLQSRLRADVETPPPSDAKDVLNEIIVTRAMGEVCGDGFTQLLRAYVVRGKYPSLLLGLWDEFAEKKGTESVRPDAFGVAQVYAIIVLPNGGPDLESYVFPNPGKSGWRQAAGLFWQVVRTLARAEDMVEFEHRDLHWGQILVKSVATSEKDSKGRGRVNGFMDDESVAGVRATVIDLGLARMTSGDVADARWTAFDEEVFEGEGDYQFDVYRMMRDHIGKSWESFKPLTNVMWLHYLTDKLLNAKHLKPPKPSEKTAGTASRLFFTERDCYESLTTMQEILGRPVAPSGPVLNPKPVKARGRPRKAPAPIPIVPETMTGSARDVLAYAIERGWVAKE